MATATKTASRTTAVGVFRTRDEAQRAVTELRRLGFKEADIGVASRDGKAVAGATKVKDAGSKAATGAAVDRRRAMRPGRRRAGRGRCRC